MSGQKPSGNMAAGEIWRYSGSRKDRERCWQPYAIEQRFGQNATSIFSFGKEQAGSITRDGAALAVARFELLH